MDCYHSALGFSSNISDRAFNEFVEYQLLDNNDIPQSLWELTKETVEGSDNSIIAKMDDSLGVICAHRRLVMGVS